MPMIKICGVRKAQDALVAAESGADFIGLVFVPNRRRSLDLESAAHIVEELKVSFSIRPEIVGLFADQSLEQVNLFVSNCKLDWVQLCGRESLEYCDAVQTRVFKVIHVPVASHSDEDAEILAATINDYSVSGHMITLDRQECVWQGGTGLSFDWQIASKLSKMGFEFVLAGGLTPSNVGEAIKIVNPWGVDVSSGVETDGTKNAEKIEAFIRQSKIASL